MVRLDGCLGLAEDDLDGCQGLAEDGLDGYQGLAEDGPVASLLLSHWTVFM
jgi:hypothetical protein